MSYHRVLAVPAAQIRVGDVILVYPDGENSRCERLPVLECSRDDSDGDVYIRWGDEGKGAKFFDPWEHVQLDVLETFGKNGGSE